MKDLLARLRLSDRQRFLVATAYGVFAVGLSIRLLRNAIVEKLVWALKQGTGDCVVNWLGARAFERGIDPYSAEGLKWAGIHVLGHPPTALLWFLPFTAYDIYDLNQAVGHLLLVMLLLHCVLLASELRAPVPIVTALLGYALISSTAWWQYEVAMMQLSEPIAFLYVLAWIFLRRRHDIAAGIMVGLAMTLKPYAALLLILFLVNRQWRAAIAAGATYVAAALVVTARFGFRCWHEFAARLPETQNYWTADIRNASVQGIVLRWWWPACGPRGHLLWQATAIATMISLVIVVGIAWQARRALAARLASNAVDARLDLPFAMFAAASAWLNPVVWEHYDVTLIQPLAIALAAAWRHRGRRAVSFAIAITLAIASIAWLLTVNVRAAQASPHVTRHLYEVANWLPWPLTLIACSVVLWRQQRAATDVDDQ